MESTCLGAFHLAHPAGLAAVPQLDQPGAKRPQHKAKAKAPQTRRANKQNAVRTTSAPQVQGPNHSTPPATPPHARCGSPAASSAQDDLLCCRPIPTARGGSKQQAGPAAAAGDVGAASREAATAAAAAARGAFRPTKRARPGHPYSCECDHQQQHCSLCSLLVCPMCPAVRAPVWCLQVAISLAGYALIALIGLLDSY